MYTIRVYTQRGGFHADGVTYASQEEADQAAREVLARSDHIGAEIRSGKTVVKKILHAEPICGVVVGSSWHHPVACAFLPGHEGEHSWASLPQYAPTELLAKRWSERSDA